MRYFIATIIFSALFSTSVFANLAKIDECKTDLYYANGILINVSERDARETWEEKATDLLLSNQEALNNIGKFGVAYNHSYGTTSDLFESFIQKAEAEAGLKVTWEAFKLFVGLQIKYADDLLSLAENVNNSIESQDLSKQIKAYKDSIKLGHGVIVVSHSQGNLFTNRAYAKLDDWMKPYFQNMGVATPAGEVASDGPYVTFDNDPIHHIPGSLADNLYNENRYYSHTNALGEQVEALTGAFHSFDYYLGTPTLINNVNVSSNKAAEKIKNFIIEKIQAHGNAPSQWQTAQEFDKGTIDYKITVKHRFDPSVVMSEQVYPFAPSEKLYYVSIGTIPGYVKASCGGTEISASWTGQQDNEFYMINNPEEEKITVKITETVQYLLPLYNQDKSLEEHSFIIDDNATQVLISLYSYAPCGYMLNGNYVPYQIYVRVNNQNVVTMEYPNIVEEDFLNVDITDVVNYGENTIEASCYSYDNPFAEYDNVSVEIKSFF